MKQICFFGSVGGTGAAPPHPYRPGRPAGGPGRPAGRQLLPAASYREACSPRSMGALYILLCPIMKQAVSMPHCGIPDGL